MSAEEPRVAAVILAAGQSKRMGGINKLLARVDGVALTARVADAALASVADPVIVVTGFEADAVVKSLKDRSVSIIHNEAYEDGMGTSLKCGIKALADDIDGAVICLADMPETTATTIDLLIDSFDAGDKAPICIPTYQGKRGNPVLLPRWLFEDVQTLAGDEGARTLIRQHAEAVKSVIFDSGSILSDIDTVEDMEKLAKGQNGAAVHQIVPHEDFPYQEKILDLADAETGHGQLDEPDATVTADNPFCGDRITLDLKASGGVITEIAHKVRGCLLCEAAASVVARAGPGSAAGDLLQVAEVLKHMLTENGDPPTGPWHDLDAFIPVRDHKSRHDCVLLPIEAALQALQKIEKGAAD